MSNTPDTCPVCGSAVPTGAPCCPDCGSDAQSGWSDHATSQHLGIPDDRDFDYEEFVKNEFGNSTTPQLRPHGIRWLWWFVALLLLAVFLSIYF